MQKSDASHINAVDGMRGCASVIVLLSHLVFFFLGRFNTALLYDPTNLLYFFLDGKLAVFVFFVLSGMVLTNAFFKTKNLASLADGAAKRYFRLVIPVFAVSILAYLMMKGGLFFNAELFHRTYAPGLWPYRSILEGYDYNFKPTLGSLVDFSFYKCFFAWSYSFCYNANCWMMPHEFAGSLTAFALAGAAIFLRRPIIIYSLIGVLLYFTFPFLAPFVWGMAIGLTEQSQTWKKFAQKRLVQALFFAFIALAFCYSAAWKQPGGLIEFGKRNAEPGPYAALLVLALFNIKPLRIFFESGFARTLGKYSFSLFLTHPLVLCSWSSFVFLMLYQRLGLVAAANWTLLLTIPVLILVVVAFKPVDRLAGYASRKFAGAVLGARKETPC